MPHDSTAQAARERAPSDGTELMTGFPPAPEAQVTLANCQDPPYSRWAFRHMRELIPSHPIPAAGPAGGIGGVVPPGASRAGPAGGIGGVVPPGASRAGPAGGIGGVVPPGASRAGP